jgi:outer membrane protein assembly factor BamE (lipoprotein component of BamABCDE complex)
MFINNPNLSFMKKILALVSILSIVGCANVADHRKALENSSEQKLTLGTAQRTITQGMAQADVVAALGSPNMVTKDKEGIETWIYDKFSTDAAYSTSSGGVAGLVIGSGGAGFGNASQAAGASSRTQRTLTIIIKFKDARVKEFTYNSTAF